MTRDRNQLHGSNVHRRLVRHLIHPNGERDGIVCVDRNFAQTTPNEVLKATCLQNLKWIELPLSPTSIAILLPPCPEIQSPPFRSI